MRPSRKLPAPGSTLKEEESLLGQFAILLGIGTDERANPEHHLEPEFVQLVDHSLRVREPLRLELEVPVIPLPVRVDHQHSGGEPVVDDRTCVLQDVVLILVVDQLDPGVELGAFNQERIRHFPARREIPLRGRAVGVGEGVPRLLHRHGPVGGGDGQVAVAELKAVGLFAPHEASPGRHQQGGALVAIAGAIEVDRVWLAAERHFVTLVDRSAPPHLSRFQFDGRRLAGGCVGRCKPGTGTQKHRGESEYDSVQLLKAHPLRWGRTWATLYFPYDYRKLCHQKGPYSDFLPGFY